VPSDATAAEHSWRDGDRARPADLLEEWRSPPDACRMVGVGHSAKKLNQSEDRREEELSEDHRELSAEGAALHAAGRTVSSFSH